MEHAQPIEHEPAPPAAEPEQGQPPQTAIASPLDLPAEQFRAGLGRRKENRRALMEWVRGALVDGVDFGRIHSVGRNKCQYAGQGRAQECPNPWHWSKPSLLKPGAEKICGMLGVTVHMPTLHDYEQAALHGVELQHVIIRCELHDAGGRVVADGVGARSLKQDAGDLNKALKMAQKSAHIDATLRMAGLSEVFTQDLEDMAASGKSAPASEAGQGESAPETASQAFADAPAKITEAQRRRLEARISECGLDRKRVKDWLRRATANRSDGPIEQFSDLPAHLYSRFEAKLDEWAAQAATAAEG